MTQSRTGGKSKKMTVSAATSRLISLILKMSPSEILEILKTVEEKELEKKRKSPRINYFMEVNYVVDDRAFSGYINNISTEGVFIETAEIFQLNSNITLTFALPNSQGHIRVAGKIVRITSEGIGIAFDLDIQTLLEKQKPDADLTVNTAPKSLLS